MKFYTKIPKNPSNVSRISSFTGEYQDYLEHGFVYDKLPAYKPKRGTLFQALSSIAGLKATWNPGYFSPVVYNNIAYATNGRILAWIDLSLVDEAERMDEGIHFNPTLWTGDLDKTEMVEASIRRLAESSWGEFKQLLEKSGEADYVTRQFRIEHMPVLKKAGQSFYCLDEATQAIWAAVNIPVCPIVHVSSASLYTWMDAVYSLMPGKQFPAVTAHLSVPKESGRKNSIYLSVEGFEYNRLGALVYGTDHFPERLTYLWTDPDADSKAGGLTLPIQKDPENDGPRWSEARLVPVHDPTDRSMIISVPGRVSDCVQVKGNNGGPELHFYCDERSMRRFYQSLGEYFSRRDAEKSES